MIVPESTSIKQKKWHNQIILRREFKAGDQVLVFNSRLRWHLFFDLMLKLNSF